MVHQTIEIKADYQGYGIETPKQCATLTTYVLDIAEDCYEQKRPAVIICPGGGYQYVSPREGEPVAMRFNSFGYHAFVLDYSTAPVRFPGSLMELSIAVAYIREHAEEYHIDESRVVVCGFSAGAHLAASLGVYWKEGFLQRFLKYDHDENRPDGMILCYPVISSKEGLAHPASVSNLLGKYPDESELALFSLEDHITELTPPAFIWHTADDNVVPSGNSIVFSEALREHDIPFELHIFPHGCHGLGLAAMPSASYLGQVIPECQVWPDMAFRFIENL